MVILLTWSLDEIQLNKGGKRNHLTNEQLHITQDKNILEGLCLFVMRLICNSRLGM